MRFIKVFSFGKIIHKRLYNALKELDTTNPNFKGCGNEFLDNREWWVSQNAKGEIMAYCGSVYTERICIFNRAWVHKSRRGFGIQKRMIKIRLRRAKQFCRIAITYTTQDNYASANNLTSCGFKMYNPEYAYGGRQMMYFMHDFD